MRLLLLSSLTSVLVVGCAGHDVTAPPAELAPVQVDRPLAGVSAPSTVVASWRVAVDDAIARVIPALGPAGAALGTPFRALRDGSGTRPSAQLVAATQAQFDAIAGKLPLDLAPDADAIRVTLDVLRSIANK